MQNVFVVDSNFDRRDFFYDILTQLNCKVTTIPSFNELMEALKKEQPECIIMDSEFDMDTVKDMLQKIRSVHERIKIIALVPGDLESAREEELCSMERITCLSKNTEAVDMVPTLLGILREQETEKEGAKVAFSESILIVDDEQEVAGLLMNYLEARGYHVDAAFNGEEALLKIRATKPKIVLLDIMMPGMDGLLVLKRIKEINNSIEVIITSGMNDEKVIAQARQLGASIYLNKPFGLEKLEAAILTSMVKPGF